MNQILTSVLCFLVVTSSLKAEKFFQILNFGGSSKLPDRVELYSDAKTSQQIKLTKNRFSPTYKIKKTGELTLIITDKTYSDPEELVGFPSVVINKSWKKFIICAIPDPQNERLPIRLIPMELGADFKKGDYRFVNFSNNKFAVKVGSKAAQLDSQSIKTLGGTAKQNQGIRMKINAWKPDTKSWRPVANQLIRHEENTRIVLFMYTPKGSIRPTYLAADIRGL